MKTCYPVLFILFAVAAGEALPPNAVPVMCAAICGPIVELSSMCTPKRSLGGLENDRTDLRAQPRKARQHDGILDERDQIERLFSIIVTAPTSFPSDLLVEQYPPTPPPASETSKLPIQSSAPVLSQYFPPPAQYPPASTPTPTPTLANTLNHLPPFAAQAVSQSPTQSTTLTHQTSIRPTIIGSAGNDAGMTGGWEETENAEEDCVCSNSSFDVAEIAGLCASCISMIADSQNDMEVIMSVCGFPSQQYSPDRDNLASNIWVKATRPTTTSKLNGAPQSTHFVSLELMFATMSFVIVAVMML